MKLLTKNIELIQEYFKTIQNDKIYFLYAEIYFEGIFYQKNLEEAFKYYKLSADQGNSYALYSLGNMYENGYGIEKNLEEAFKYYNLSAEKGNDGAKKNKK